MELLCKMLGQTSQMSSGGLVKLGDQSYNSKTSWVGRVKHSFPGRSLARSGDVKEEWVGVKQPM